MFLEITTTDETTQKETLHVINTAYIKKITKHGNRLNIAFNQGSFEVVDNLELYGNDAERFYDAFCRQETIYTIV